MNTDMQIKRLPIDALKPAKYNPRKDLKPGDPAYEKIRRSLHDFGYVDPIIWNEVTGNIVGGHQRYKVLKAEGTTEVDCVVVHIENPNDEKALNIALNKATGEWEPVALAELLQDLQLTGYDLNSTGFDAAEVDDLFSLVHDKDVRDDETALDPATIMPFVKPGDVWTLGRHVLLCGDNMDRLMGGTRANLMITDLPASEDGINVDDLKKTFIQGAAHLADGGSAYIFHDDRDGLGVRRAFKDAGFHLSGVCVWLNVSTHRTPGRYRPCHEPILYGWLPHGKHRWFSDRKQTTVWRFDRPPHDGPGPALKPVPLIAYPIRNSTAPNGVVLDPCGGMGGTLIACEQLDRLCRTMEKDERYASVIVRRYIDFIGRDDDVTVERDGRKLTYQEAAEG